MAVTMSTLPKARGRSDYISLVRLDRGHIKPPSKTHTSVHLNGATTSNARCLRALSLLRKRSRFWRARKPTLTDLAPKNWQAARLNRRNCSRGRREAHFDLYHLSRDYDIAQMANWRLELFARLQNLPGKCVRGMFRVEDAISQLGEPEETMSSSTDTEEGQQLVTC